MGLRCPGTPQHRSPSPAAKRSWVGPGWAWLLENPGRWGACHPQTPGQTPVTGHPRQREGRTFQEVVRFASSPLQGPGLGTREPRQAPLTLSPAQATRPWPLLAAWLRTGVLAPSRLADQDSLERGRA